MVIAFIGMNPFANEDGFTFKSLSGSIYLEVDYLQHYANTELVSGVSISIGSRGWINK